MGEKELKGLGISARIISAGVIVWLSMQAYRNYVELQRTRLQIKILRKQLGMPADVNNVDAG